MSKIVVTLCIFAFFAEFGFAGTESGGGGGGVYSADRSTLTAIDLYWIPKCLKNTTASGSSLIDQNYLNSVLTPWIGSFFDLYALYLVSQSNITWKNVKKLNRSYSHTRPPNVSGTIETIAYCTWRDRHATVEVLDDAVKKMGQESRAAIAIHESLRDFQLGGRSLYPGQEYLDDEALQKATAIYVLCKPNIDLELYITALLNYGAAETDIRAGGSFEQYMDKFCHCR